MALLRELFARKAMDGLSPVSERVFVFNSCMSTEALDQDAHKDYLTSTIIQLKGSNPYASLMVVNFAAAPTAADAVHSLLQNGAATVVVTDYPSRYAGCPSLPLPMIRTFLGSCVDWLVSSHQRNILLMHCDGGNNGAAWPALAFAMASLLVYIGEAEPEQRTLDAVYGRAPVEMLSAGSALDPRPSHLRYLQYVARLRDKGSQMGMMKQEHFVLDCLILRAVPDFDGRGGCRPVVRVHGETQTDASTKVLFSTPRIKQQFKHYKQAESAVIKADIGCQIQGDVVIECIHVGDQDHEDIMFRVIFNTCFLQSNMMVITLEDIDLAWNSSKEKFQEDFKIEVFFSEVELSDIDESNELSSLGNTDEFYDFDEILIDSDFDLKDHEWNGLTSQQDHGPEADLDAEGSETRASDSASSSSEEKRDDDEIEASDSDSASNNSSEEKGSIRTEDELVHGGDVTRETKDARLGETSYLLEVGSSCSSSSNIPPIVPTRRSIIEELPTNDEENTSAHEGVVPQGLIPMQDGGNTSSVNEASHRNEAAYGALNSQPMRKIRQKQAAIISPVPVIRKKIRKTDTPSDDKKPAISNVPLRVGSQKRAVVPTSSSKNSASQAKTTPSPPKPYEIANRLKQGTAQARRTSNLSKEHLNHSSQQAGGDPRNQKHFANGTAAGAQVKQIVFTGQTTPSFAPSPLGRELNQEDSKGSGSPSDKNKKPITHPSEKPRTGKTQKQEATTSSVIQAPHRTTVMKKSLSLPAISKMTTIASPGKSGTSSLPGIKTSRPTAGFHIATSSSSPRAHKHGMSPPSSPGRSPLAGSKFHRAVPVAQPDMQKGTSAPVRLPRHASLGELSKSIATSRASDGHSLSPKTSRVSHNHPDGVRGSARSLSPLSARLTRTQPSTKTAAAVTVSSSKDNSRTGAAPARPTR